MANGLESAADILWMERLPSRTTDGQARRSAIATATQSPVTPTSVVSYLSAGYVLVIADDKSYLQPARVLARHTALKVVVCLPELETETGQHDDFTLLQGIVTEVTGHLGQFCITVNQAGMTDNLAQLAGTGQGYFDMVLDLGAVPLLACDVLPPGYFAPAQDASALVDALEQIPGLVGEFEKPKYFNYNPDICAHGNSGLTGCTRCIDTCSSVAISSLGDKIEVNPHLCQGLGSCATVCPSGAISYAYPVASDVLEKIRAILRVYRQEGGEQPLLLLHDHAAGRHLQVPYLAALPEYVIPVEVEDIGAVGLDVCLAALAYGAQRVVLLVSAATPKLAYTALHEQLNVGRALLAGMDFDTGRLALLKTGDANELVTTLTGFDLLPVIEAATFAAIDEKRTILFLSIDHLYQQSAVSKAMLELPAGAPFGEIRVDKAACSLCMACVSVCPAAALEACDETPQLSFIESNCVQCGLCETACPEQAIQCSPRYVFDVKVRKNRRTLYAEQPFNCVICGKPFASETVIKNIHEKLSNHWMFQTQQAQRRLEMCEDCRVRDMLGQKEVVNEHKNTGMH